MWATALRQPSRGRYQPQRRRLFFSRRRSRTFSRSPFTRASARRPRRSTPQVAQPHSRMRTYGAHAHPHARKARHVHYVLVSGEPSSYVSEWKVKLGGRGGDRVVDSFQFGNADLVSNLLSQREVVMRREGLAICLVGPITFMWESSLTDPQVSRLRVTGHIATLQCVPKVGPVWTLPTFTVWTKTRTKTRRLRRSSGPTPIK